MHAEEGSLPATRPVERHLVTAIDNPPLLCERRSDEMARVVIRMPPLPRETIDPLQLDSVHGALELLESRLETRHQIARMDRNRRSDEENPLRTDAEARENRSALAIADRARDESGAVGQKHAE